MSFRSFCRRIAEWKAKTAEDEKVLETANIAYKFAPHASTVQVNGKGQVVQAWIKQHTNERVEELLAAIRENITPVKVEPAEHKQSNKMLEIPLYDLHFGIADFEFYRNILQQVIQIISSGHWDKIVIPVGQDLFHNDSIVNPVTTKGTQIEKVDMTKAVKDAQAFYYNIIDAAIANSNETSVIYSPGNHDKTVGWMFAEILRCRYGDIVEDSVKERKAVWWEGCCIGITHGDKRNDTASGLRGKFTMDFPIMFATAKVKEIHAGHLHSEKDSDEFGIRVRRLSSANKTDAWTEDMGYGSHKRFMLFEYEPNKLKSIHYVE